MLNRIIIMGRLTRDPEYRTTGSGLSVANFSVAVERDFSGDGEKQTDFIDCVAWRKTAEFITKYFRKGAMIAVSGRLQIRDWQDKDGNKRRTAEILVENAYFAGSKQATATPATPASYNHPTVTDFEPLDADDAQLPF